jgi:hypothetical protein
MHKKNIAIIVIALLAALPAAAATVKINQNHTPVRAEATTTGTVVAYYQAGDVLELVNAIQGWYKVRDPRTKQEGFVLTSLVELLPGDAGAAAAAGKPPAEGPAAATGGKPSPAQASVPATGNAVPKKAAPASRWTDIGFISVDGGYQSGSEGFSDSFSFASYVEQATLTTQYPKKDGPTFSVGGAFRVWRNLAAGVAVTAVSRSTSGGVTGSIPHPFFFNTGRAVTAEVGLQRNETGVHLQAAYVIPSGRKMLVTVSGGPSFFSVKQSLLESVQVSESYPYDSAGLASPAATSVTKSATGFNVGADVGYFFSRMVGVGGMVRYASGTVSLPVHGSSISTKVGGVQAGVGLRLRIPRSAPKKTPAKAPAPPPPAPVRK